MNFAVSRDGATALQPKPHRKAPSQKKFKYFHTRIAILKNKQKKSVDKDVQRLEPLKTASDSIIQSSLCVKSFGVSSNSCK